MARILAQGMSRRGWNELRLLSLCEFRGIPTPPDPLGTGARVVRLSPLRRPRGMRQKSRGSSSSRAALSRMAHRLAWRWLLKRNALQALDSRPDLVILFNDAAFPYDRIVALLNRKGIPFLLIQEGIRFEARGGAVDGALNQGRGGAAAIAVFGETSAEYFARQGAPRERIHVTGNPRFDEMSSLNLDAEASEIRARLGLAGKSLLFLSNPIEFHGYTTTEGKMRLVRDFSLGLTPLFERDESFRLIFKLHGQEKIDDFREAVDESPHRSSILFAEAENLHALLKAVDAAVVFGTTAGLEGLRLGVPLGVVEVPGVGYLHDYVREGAALALSWDEPMAGQVSRLLDGQGPGRAEVDRYLARSLASGGDATERIIDLAETLLHPESRREPAPTAATSGR